MWAITTVQIEKHQPGCKQRGDTKGQQLSDVQELHHRASLGSAPHKYGAWADGDRAIQPQMDLKDLNRDLPKKYVHREWYHHC